MGRYCEIRQFCAYYDQIKKKDEAIPPGKYQLGEGMPMKGESPLRSPHVLLKSAKSFKRYWPLREDFEDWCDQKVILPAK